MKTNNSKQGKQTKRIKEIKAQGAWRCSCICAHRNHRETKKLETVTYPFVFHKPISIFMDFSLLFVKINFILCDHR